MTIKLHIERLVLEGFDLTAGDRRRLHNSVASHLARLLQRTDSVSGWTAGSTRTRLDAGRIQLPRSRSSVQLGRQIARAVYGRIIR
jgi:hypothetical protein